MRLETCTFFLLGVVLCSPHQINVWNNIRSKVDGIRTKVTSAVKDVLGVKQGNGEYPEFCNNLKCPKFTTISKGDGYEERCYEESTWVMTSMQVPHKQTTCMHLLLLYPIFKIFFHKVLYPIFRIFFSKCLQ